MSLGEELFAAHRPHREPDDQPSEGTLTDAAPGASAGVDEAVPSPPGAPTHDDPASPKPASSDPASPAPVPSDPASPAPAPSGDGADLGAEAVPAAGSMESDTTAGETGPDEPADPSDAAPLPAPRLDRDDAPAWVRDAGPDATVPLTVGSRPAGPPAPGTVDDTGPVPVTASRPVTAGDLRDATTTTSPRPADPDATTVVALDGRTIAGGGSGAAVTTGDAWDTGTIRRWDPSMTDERTGPATGAMHRPYPLDEREDVDVAEPQPASRWYEVPLMVLIALTLAFLLRTFVVQVFYIPSTSMVPTLEVNDRIAVEKLSYIGREPARGEVVVFAGDDPFAAAEEVSAVDRILTGVGQFVGVVPVDAKDFVKRVIGLPGDTVTLTDGVVSVNGTQLDEPYACLDQDSGEWQVPEGELFVMGDNRANSGDSRTSLGFVPIDDVVGRSFVTIWPFDRAGSITGPDDQRAGACP